MRKITFLVIAFCLAIASVNAQTIFEEDFESGLSTWTVYDQDGLTPNPAVGFITNGWNAIDRDGANGSFGGPAGNMAAMSTSWYTTPGTSNDWLVSPAITLTTGNILEFDAKAQDPTYSDGYVLKLSTTGNAVADFTTTLLTVPAEFGASGNNYKHRIVDLSAYDNQTVYLAWVNNSTDKFLLLIDNVKVSPIPDCMAPTSIAVDSITSSQAKVTWSTYDNSANGFQIQVFIAGDDPQTATPTYEDLAIPAGDTTTTITGLSASTSYDVYLKAQCSSADSDNITTSFSTTVANDNCDGAIELSVGTDFNDQAILADNRNASTSLNAPAPECGLFNLLSIDQDVWFKVTVPASGYLVVETQMNANNADNIQDTGLQILSGDCTSLTSLMCNDNNPVDNSFFSRTFVSGLTPGDVINIRVWGILGTIGEFKIAAYEPTCPQVSDISIGNFNNGSATITWVENGSATAWEIVYGESGFDVTDPNAGTSISANTNPTTTLANLQPLTSYDVYVKAVCGANSESIYAPVVSFAIPPANDDICNATPLTVDAGCQDPEIYNNIGATLESGEPTGSCYSSAGENTVWFTFVAPQGPNGSSSVVVSTALTTGGTLTDSEIAVFEAPADCADASTLGTELACNEDVSLSEGIYNSTVELSGLTAGETYYVQVTGFASAAGTFCLVVNNNACPPPTDLAVSDVTDQSATINWTPGNTETTWTVEYGPQGFSLGSGTSINVNTTPQTALTGLSSATTYDVYVTASCSSQYQSAAIGPVSFTTFATGKCGQIQISNNYENGLFDEAGGQTLADDFIIAINEKFSVEQITLSVLSLDGVASVDLTFYTDNTGLPGDEVTTLTGIVPTSQNTVGTAFGYDIQEVILDLATPVELEGDPNVETTYWVEYTITPTVPDPVNFQATGVEVTSVGIVGNPMAFNDNAGNGWNYANDGNGAYYDGVVSILGSCSSLGVENQIFREFTYYPNPVENQLTLEAQSPIEQYTLYDISGKQLMHQTPNSPQVTVNTSRLSSGIYFVQVHLQGHSKTFKIIKK